jgi:hypothetical protein
MGESEQERRERELREAHFGQEAFLTFLLLCAGVILIALWAMNQ